MSRSTQGRPAVLGAMIWRGLGRLSLGFPCLSFRLAWWPSSSKPSKIRTWYLLAVNPRHLYRHPACHFLANLYRNRRATSDKACSPSFTDGRGRKQMQSSLKPMRDRRQDCFLRLGLINSHSAARTGRDRSRLTGLRAAAVALTDQRGATPAIDETERSDPGNAGLFADICRR